MNALFSGALILIVRGYQCTLGLLLGGNCRFTPTCSNYAIDSLRTHGPWRGGALAARRLLRCHPWGGHGIDHVPEPTDSAFVRRANDRK